MLAFIGKFEEKTCALMRIVTSFLFLCSGMAAAAYWVGHFPDGWLPLLNRGESAALFASVFPYLAASGTGAWGLSKG